MAPNNSLHIHGNEKTMNLNHLILTNIQSSPYFKVNLYELKTYHEVIDEIYYKVTHLEPWEKGSRKTAGQTGMCGGVRGVGAGGIVSSAFCLLYKLCTLKLTRKQVIGLMEHSDSPYIRALGFMYIRYTQPPADYWEWYMPYLEDEEELDVKAGGGHTMTIGEVARQWLTKIEWYTTLFPRIPVPIQKMLEGKLREYDANKAYQPPPQAEDPGEVGHIPDGQLNFGEAERLSNLRGPEDETSSRSSPFLEQRPHLTERNSHDRARPTERDHKRQQQRDRERRDDSYKEPKRKSRSQSRDRHRRRSRSHDRHKHNRHKDSDHKHRDHKHRDRHRSRSRDRQRSRSRDRHSNSKHMSKSSDKHSRHHRSRSREKTSNHSSSNHGGRESSFERDLRREKARQKRAKDKHSHRNGDK